MTLNWPKKLKRLVGLATSLCFLLGHVLAPAALAATEAERASEIATQMKAAMTAIEDGQRDAARDRWDPAYIVETIGIEPKALHTWVRSNVTWVPYRGALRGPVGVLMDRKGNSLDQALLLAELLKASGRRVRLAHVQLSANVASAELQRLIAARNLGEPVGPLAPQTAKAAAEQFVDDSGVLDTADAYGIDRKALAEKLKGQVTRANTIANKLTQRMREQSRALWPALSAQSAEAARKGVLDQALVAIGDHWWVQMNKDGQWVDLDLLSSNGAALAPPTQTADTADLTGGIEHKITLRLVIGQWKQGKTSEAVALEQSFRPRDLIGKSVKLMHVPSLWPADWPEVTEDDIQIKLRAALYTQKEWLPVLAVDGKQFMRASIMDTGVVNQSPNSGNPFQRMTVPAVGQIAKATDILATIGDPDEKPKADPTSRDPKTPRPEGELVGEWLEFEFAAPGEEPRKIRREIFDLIGPAARASNGLTYFTMSDDKKVARSMAALGETEMLIMPNALAPEFLLHMTASNAMQNKEFIDELAGDPFGKTPANAVETASKITPFPAALYGFAAMRFSANPHAAQLFVDRPLVVLQHATLARGKGGDFHTGRALDIVDNRIGVDPAAARQAQQYRLLQGIVDTNTEAEALRMLNETVTANTGDAFAASLKAGKGWTMLRPGEEGKLAALKVSPDMTARMLADLKAGQIVVASAGGEIGWWRIDPATGTTLGMGANGTGAAMVEYALVIIIQTIISVAQCLVARAGAAAIERTLNELGNEKIGKSRPSAVTVVDAVGAGVKAGVKQGKESFEESKKTHHRRCFAVGMMGGFDAGMMMATFDLAKFIAKKEVPVGYGGGEGPGGEKKPSATNDPPSANPLAKTEPNAKGSAEPKGDTQPPGKGHVDPMGDTQPGNEPQAKNEKGQQNQTEKPQGDKPRPPPTPEQIEQSIKNERAAFDKAEKEAKKLSDLEKQNDQSPQGQKELQEQRERSQGANDEYERAAVKAFGDISASGRDFDRWQDYRHGRGPLPSGAPPGGPAASPMASTGGPPAKPSSGVQGSLPQKPPSGGQAPVDPFGKTGQAPVDPLGKTGAGDSPLGERPAPESDPLDKTTNDKKISDDYPQEQPQKYTPKEIEQNIQREKELRGKVEQANKKLDELEKKADSNPSPQNEAELKRVRQETEDMRSEYGAAEKQVGDGLLQEGNSREEVERLIDLRRLPLSSSPPSTSPGAAPPPTPSSAAPKETLVGLGEMGNAFGNLPPP